MLKTVYVSDSSLGKRHVKKYKTDSITDLLKSLYDKMPDTARIYHKAVCKKYDVTPHDAASEEYMESLEGGFWVIVYRGEVTTWAIVSAALLFLSVATVFIFKPKIPNVTARNTRAQSPNNELSARVNRERINGRINDIFGTVRCTPDLIAVPYTVFEDNQEVEYALMRIGQGSYDIPLDEIKDDTTPVSQIDGMSVEIYGKNTRPAQNVIYENCLVRYTVYSDGHKAISLRIYGVGSSGGNLPGSIINGYGHYTFPDEVISSFDWGEYTPSNTWEIETSGWLAGFGGDASWFITFNRIYGTTGGTSGTWKGALTFNGSPEVRIGQAISEPLKYVSRTTAVNGQVLRPPNGYIVRGNNNIRFISPNIIETNSTSINFQDYFKAGDPLGINGAFTSSSSSSVSKNITIIVQKPTVAVLEMPSTGSGETPPASYLEYIRLNNTKVQHSLGVLSSTYDISGIYTVEDVDHIEVTSGVWVWRIVILIAASYYETDYKFFNVKFRSAWNNDLTGYYTSSPVVIDNLPHDLDLSRPLITPSTSYNIYSVSPNRILLDNPSSLNPDWDSITETPYTSANLYILGYRREGEFILSGNNLTEIKANFVALQGLWKEGQDGQKRVDVQVALEVQRIDNSGNPIGLAVTYTETLRGSSVSKDSKGVTLNTGAITEGRYKVTAYRLTNTDSGFDGTVSDEIKIRDLYGCVEPPEVNYGDVTTVYSRTPATSGALAIKERKLNMLVTRKIKLWQPELGTFTMDIFPTNRADHIFMAVCLDPKIGGRIGITSNDVDFQNIYETVQEVIEYFGTEKAAEFCYTFDNSDLSPEQSLALISQAIFCKSYRRGRKIRLYFEKETDESVLLFNHRNKDPRVKEQRDLIFGTYENFDGVTVSYVDPSDDSIVEYYLPEDQSALNPKVVETVGVRNKIQAHFLAWREYQKILYGHSTVSFTATQEADLLIYSDRVLIADNTRPHIQDGEVMNQDGLTLTLSQKVTFEDGKEYRIFLQHYNASVESIGVEAGDTPYEVLLEHAPSYPLSLDNENYARALYWITSDTDNAPKAYMITEKTPNNDFTVGIVASNYDDRFYSHDKDYINGIIE
jgi:hypothetical protein